MQPSQHHSRINLADLKAQIVKKLGSDRSKQYFYYLNRLLSQKLSKAEFDKLCCLTLGRENLPLHNQFIQSILKNACHSKVPPTIHKSEVLKSTTAAGKKSPTKEDGYLQNGPSPIPTQAPISPLWPNGDVLPMSPRKGRSGIRDRKLKDRPSPLGLNGKANYALHKPRTTDDNSFRHVMENGELAQCDFQKRLQNLQGFAEKPENEEDSTLQHHSRRSQIKRTGDGSVSVHNRGQNEVVFVDGDEVEQANNSNSNRSLLHAPLGIPFCSASVGGARRTVPVSSSSNVVSYFDSGGLYDSETLRKRLEQIAGGQGLEGVSTDCANLLNNGLDAYLKRLIRSCIELVGSRSGYTLAKHPTYKHQLHGKLVNGVVPVRHFQMQNSGVPLDGMLEQRSTFPVTLLDFKVAMELNPQQLGEDWSLLLEKISMQAFEE